MVFYYAGHGVCIKGETNALLPVEDAKKRFFRLDFYLKALAEIDGLYILALLDCCRDYMKEAVRRDREDSEGEQESSQIPKG